ncbi:tRNA methyltransferase 2 [Entophlyctis sp. JEL0112]|nr:tRNA methyltransferase 2 [Entophlyctis sp. JEL0112]
MAGYEEEEEDDSAFLHEEESPAVEDVAVAGDSSDLTAASQAGTSATNDRRFQLKLNGLGKRLTAKDLEKAIKANAVKGVVKTKKVFNMTSGIIYFNSAEARENAIAKVEAFVLKGSDKITTMIDDRDGNSRNNGTDSPSTGESVARAGKRKREDNEIADANDGRTPAEKINDQVTPLWRIPYEDQLNSKLSRFKKGLANLKRELYSFTNKRDTPEDKRKELDYIVNMGRDCICELQKVVPSPVVDGYRNKCEFTVGFDLDGKPTVGFLLGLFKEGVTCVLPPTECKNVPPAANLVAEIFQKVLLSSKLGPYDRVKKEGFWRLLQVRCQSTGDVMVVAQVNPVGSDVEVQKSAIEILKESFLANGNVKTLLLQESSEAHNGFIEALPCKILFGEGVIYEEILELKSFRISPTSFFQVNTEATKGLYSCIRDWVANPLLSKEATEGPKIGSDSVIPENVHVERSNHESLKNIVILDLCCGTGTIGLTLAPKVKKVVGIEMVKEAIQDAEFNARLQNQENVTYICKKVEHAMREVFKVHVSHGDDVVAILDPPRAGVHDDVIRAIRGCSGIKRVIFVSCDFENALKNFVS